MSSQDSLREKVARPAELTIEWPADTAEAPFSLCWADVWKVSVNGRRPLERWTPEEVSAGIVDKAQPGDPVIYSFWTEQGQPRLRLWPVPTAPSTLTAFAQAAALPELAVRDALVEALGEGPDCADRAAAETAPLTLSEAGGLRDLLGEISGHLGAALSQSLPEDDRIIMGHVRDAQALVTAALRLEARS